VWLALCIPQTLCDSHHSDLVWVCQLAESDLLAVKQSSVVGRAENDLAAVHRKNLSATLAQHLGLGAPASHDLVAEVELQVFHDHSPSPGYSALLAWALLVEACTTTVTQQPYKDPSLQLAATVEEEYRMATAVVDVVLDLVMIAFGGVVGFGFGAASAMIAKSWGRCRESVAEKAQELSFALVVVQAYPNHVA